MQEIMKKKALELLSSGTVDRVLGWEKGEFDYDITPAVFDNAEDIEKNLVYGAFCGGNLSKYLVKESKKEGKILVFLKPCDSYSFSQLIKEHRVIRENIYAVGIECFGKADIDIVKEKTGITTISNKSFSLYLKMNIQTYIVIAPPSAPLNNSFQSKLRFAFLETFFCSMVVVSKLESEVVSSFLGGAFSAL